MNQKKTPKLILNVSTLKSLSLKTNVKAGSVARTHTWDSDCCTNHNQGLK